MRAVPGALYCRLEHVQAWLGPRPVLHDLNLQLHQGEHTVVLGPNGAGKTALIKLISRELYPVVTPAMRLELFGSSQVNLWQLRRRLGVMHSDLLERQPGALTVEEIVLASFFGATRLGRCHQPDPQQRQRTAELLEQLHLADLANRPFGELSEGQRRRVLLARALVHQPEVLVLDEPTNALDLRARHQLLELLRHLATTGTTLLLVTHQVEAIIPEIQRCVLLGEGRIQGDGSVGELMQAEPLSRLFGTPLQVLRASGYHLVLPA